MKNIMLIALLIFALGTLHPATRPLVFFILPLGIRPDDLIVWGIFSLVIGLWLVGKIYHEREKTK